MTVFLMKILRTAVKWIQGGREYSLCEQYSLSTAFGGKLRHWQIIRFQLLPGRFWI